MAKDFSKLTGRIVEKFGTRTAFCKVLGRNPEWLSRRLNNKIEFDADEIATIIDLLEIEPQDLHLYFLCPNVR